MHEYSTSDTLLLKEYGRNIQKLVKHLMTIPDKHERTKLAYALVDLMKQIHPNYKEVQDTQNKFWDDLYIISNFNLDIDAPFPMPDKSAIGKKPSRVPYNQNTIAFKHYGKNVELMADKISQIEDLEQQKSGLIHLARMMKQFYITWNRDHIEDQVLIDHLKLLNKGRFKVNIEEIFTEGYLDTKPSKLPYTNQISNNGGNGNGLKNKNNKKKKRNNKNRNR